MPGPGEPYEPSRVCHPSDKRREDSHRQSLPQNDRGALAFTTSRRGDWARQNRLGPLHAAVQRAALRSDSRTSQHSPGESQRDRRSRDTSRATSRTMVARLKVPRTSLAHKTPHSPTAEMAPLPAESEAASDRMRTCSSARISAIASLTARSPYRSGFGPDRRSESAERTGVRRFPSRSTT